MTCELTDLEIPDESALQSQSFDYLEKFFVNHKVVVLSMLVDEEDVKQVNLLYDKLDKHRPLEEFEEQKNNKKKFEKQMKLKIVIEVDDEVYDQEVKGTIAVMEPIVHDIIVCITLAIFLIFVKTSLQKMQKEKEKLTVDTTVFG